MYKHTPKAITSYGAIAFIRSPQKFLICQRRDTFEYIEFLRGLWNHEKDLPGLFMLMSIEERERIEKYSFRELWDDVWVTKDHHLYNNTTRAEYKYNSIKHKIPELLKNLSYITEAPWCFPKGKKIIGHPEEDIETAKREFFEETQLSTDAFTLRYDGVPFVENFVGTNRKHYCTKFFVFEAFEETYPTKIKINNPLREWIVSDETNDVKWMSIEDIRTYIHPRRWDMLQKIIGDISLKKI